MEGPFDVSRPSLRAVAACAASLVAGGVLLVLAGDLRNLDRALGRDDMRFAAAVGIDPTYWDLEPIEDPRYQIAASRRYWELASTLPSGLGERLLGIRDDLVFREALGLFWRSRPGDVSGVYPTAPGFRARAKEALIEVARSDADARQKSAAENMLGVLTLGGEQSSDIEETRARLQSAIALFQDAIELDPDNEQAKINLELALSGICNTCLISGVDPAGAPLGGGGSGAGREGRGY